MKNLLKIMTFALVMGLLLYGFDAAAEDVFQRTFKVMARVFSNVRMVVYIFGAFGLIGIAVMAIMGKMQFKTLAYMAIGLAIVAAADLVVSYAVKSGKSGSQGSAGSFEAIEWEDKSS